MCIYTHLLEPFCLFALCVLLLEEGRDEDVHLALELGARQVVLGLLVPQSRHLGRMWEGVSRGYTIIIIIIGRVNTNTQIDR